MEEKIYGLCLCWCSHHHHSIEQIDFEERLEDIMTNKPHYQQAARRRSFKPVKGEIPDEVVEACKILHKAWADYDKARDYYYKARADYEKARADYKKADADCDKARVDFYKARADLEKANADYDKTWDDYKKAEKAYDEVITKHKDYLNKLHREEVPDTAWDGEKLVYD